MNNQLIIPPRKIIEQLEAADPRQEIFCVDRYYSPLWGWVYRKRLRIALELMGDKNYENILDIGFGSGIFLPSLKKKTRKLFGIDRHNFVGTVKDIMARVGVETNITSGDILRMPYNDNEFDCIVCMSALEFIADIDAAMKEISRVAAPDADIIVGAPIASRLTDFSYGLIGKKGQNMTHKSDHKKIIESVKKNFEIKKIKTLPNFMPISSSLFFVLLAKNKK